ncbi:MAG: hypothetical protein K5879_01000 [Lachnospiraceae bacterium]|nr:hypothetical protein [Lachnospiraceae bacterium]
MNKKTMVILNKLKLIGLILYFLILFVERLLAVILSFHLGGEYALLSGNVFNYIAYGITAISLIAGLVLMIRVLPAMFVSVFTSKEYDFAAGYKPAVIAAMALLFGGMMHTGFTVAPIQFVAYGFLIGSMIVRTIECCMEVKEHALPDGNAGVAPFGKKRRFSSIVSVIYLTLLAMAVPVSYISFQDMPMRAVFFAVEFTAVFVLVPVFGILLLKFYDTGVTSFSFVYPLLMVILSGLTVALKWKEEINWFVLVFVVLTMVFYLSFGLIAGKVKR